MLVFAKQSMSDYVFLCYNSYFIVVFNNVSTKYVKIVKKGGKSHE